MGSDFRVQRRYICGNGQGTEEHHITPINSFIQIEAVAADSNGIVAERKLAWMNGLSKFLPNMALLPIVNPSLNPFQISVNVLGLIAAQLHHHLFVVRVSSLLQ